MFFFEGTLQEGISTAVQQSKFVVCFVTDGAEESEQWQDSFLADAAIAPLLAAEAVLLRLQAGSEEAGYLAAIFPLPKTPTLVIIKNGELKEYIAAGVTRDEFLRRVYAAFRPGQTPPGVPAAAAAAATQPAPPAPPAATSAHAAPSRPAAHESRQEAAPQPADAEHRSAVAKGKLPAAAGGGGDGDGDPAKKALRTASQQYAERQRQAREERRRVLERIEADKAARRAREEERRAEREAAAGAQQPGPAAGATEGAAAAAGAGAARRHDHCNLQVRLFDGSTIRTRLPSGGTVRADVRRWVDEARGDAGGAYEFKEVLTPLPNRRIDAVEEDRTLEELGLAPSATLILVPVASYAAAYAAAGRGNPVARAVAPVLGLLAWFVGALTGLLGSLFSPAAGPPAPEEIPLRDLGRRRGGDPVQGRGRPDDRQRDQQLYNGNSLNFEPRRDDEEDEQ